MSFIERSLSFLPDTGLYNGLTEKQRMLAGFPYRPADNELVMDRHRARTLVKQYNSLDADDKVARRTLLDELIHSDSRGKDQLIKSVFRVSYGFNLTAGDDLYVNIGCVFLDSAPITIGDNCLFGPGVHIYTSSASLDSKNRKENEELIEVAFPVKIGNDCWIGGNSIICPGVTIGNNVTIGAGSVVTTDIPSNVIAAGNPAKCVKNLKN